MNRDKKDKFILFFFFLTDDMIVPLERSTNYQNRKVNLARSLNTSSIYKNQLHFYILARWLENKIEKKIPFTIVSKKSSG